MIWKENENFWGSQYSDLKLLLKTLLTKNSLTKKSCCWILTIWLSAVPIQLQFLIVYKTEDLKTKKSLKKKETATLRCGLMRKMPISRSSHQRCSIKKGVLRKFSKFTGKHLCQRLWHRCFPVNFEKFLRTPFLQNTSGRLLLNFRGFRVFNFALHVLFLQETKLLSVNYVSSEFVLNLLVKFLKGFLYKGFLGHCII